jgi:uncharacterized membrane protein YcaP (DUF421 family)
MSDLAGMLLRVSLTYAVLLVLLRVSGRRSIKATTPFDLIISLVVGDLPDDMIWGEVPFMQGVVAIVTLVALHLLVEWATYRSLRLDRWLGGIATPLLRSGVVEPGAAREHVGDEELDAMLRLHGVDRRSEVAQAMLEPSGGLSIVRRDDAARATARDLRDLRRAG